MLFPWHFVSPFHLVPLHFRLPLRNPHTATNYLYTFPSSPIFIECIFLPFFDFTLILACFLFVFLIDLLYLRPSATNHLLCCVFFLVSLLSFSLIPYALWDLFSLSLSLSPWLNSPCVSPSRIESSAANLLYYCIFFHIYILSFSLISYALWHLFSLFPLGLTPLRLPIQNPQQPVIGDFKLPRKCCTESQTCSPKRVFPGRVTEALSHHR